MTAFQFTQKSTLTTSPEKLWTDITQFKNINYELMPFARMTCPKHLNTLAPDTIPLDTPLFKSIILLLGIIPIDLHCLQISQFKPQQGFWENSSSMMHRTWQHTRTLTPINEHNTQISDTLLFEPRLPFVGYLLLPIYKMVFENRHQKLIRKYG